MYNHESHFRLPIPWPVTENMTSGNRACLPIPWRSNNHNSAVDVLVQDSNEGDDSFFDSAIEKPIQINALEALLDSYLSASTVE